MIAERFLVVGLTNAVVATALAALLWILCRYVRAPHPVRAPHLVRFLALVVLLRFLAPPLLPWSLLPARGDGGGDIAAASVLPLPPSDLGQATDQRTAGAQQTAGAEEILALVAGDSPASSWAGPLAGILWALGFVATSGLVLVRERRFRAALRRARRGSPELVRRVDRLGARLGLRRSPEVLLVEQRQSPAVVAGARRDFLVLPELLLDQLSRDELDTVLVHELAHLRRRDGWVRWIEVAACCVFWWNPAASWTRRRLRQAEEECCDEMVLRLFPQRAADYVAAIVKTLDMTRNHNLPAGATAMASVDRMEERLKMILEHTPRARRPWVAAGVGVLAIAVLCVFPTFSQELEEHQQDVLEERLDGELLEAERLEAERLYAERLYLEDRRIDMEQRRLDEALRRQAEDVEYQESQLVLERERLDFQISRAESEADRRQLHQELRRLDVHQREFEDRHRLEAERLAELARRELQIQRVRLETELETDRMLQRTLELTLEARALREQGQHEDATRLADEVLLERERIELRRAELELQRAEVLVQERQAVAEARERAREGRERAREGAARAQADDQRVRRTYEERYEEARRREIRSRDREERRVRDGQRKFEVSRQLHRLSQLLEELGDDGQARLELQQLEEKLEELLEKKAAAEEETDSQDP